MPQELAHWTVFLETAIENAWALTRHVSFWGSFTLTGQEGGGQLYCDILNLWEKIM